MTFPSPEQTLRYSRHLTLPEVGLDGQRALAEGSVLLVGAGGLGSPAAVYLAAAGVGRLGLVEFDRVDFSNLQRQVLYSSADVGREKLAAARERLLALNPDVRVETHACAFDEANGLDLVDGYDVVVDGSDNFRTRYLVNDACVLRGKPDVYGSVFRFEGQVTVFGADAGPCYRCLFPDPPPPGSVPDCATGGVLGVLPGVIGTLQAVEAIKLLLGKGEPLHGRLLLFDALEMRFRELRVPRDAGCALCGERPSIRGLAAVQVAACAADAPEVPTIEPAALQRRLGARDAPALLDVRSETEWAIARLPGARLVPLEQLGARLAELDREAAWVVYCKAGTRSARAVRLLREHGYRRVENLAGGLDRWAGEIDPAMPRY